MKKITEYLPVIISLAGIKFLIQWVGNQNYGFHRDELLHLSVSEHLDWGYFEFPPLIALMGKISHFLFGYTLWGTRLFPTLAGVAILIVCCMIAVEMGGKIRAVLLAGVCVLAFPPFYRNHLLFQPVAFDQLAWVMGYYFLIKYINTKNIRFLLLTGFTAGIGLMNKYTILVWGAGVAIGLLFYERGTLFKNRWLYLSGLIAFLIVLPNFLWQVNHDFPLLLHLQTLKERQLDQMGPFDYGITQLYFPFTLAISIVGTIGLFCDTELRKYKSIGIAVLVTFVTMWVLRSKAYYIFAVYPVVFAAGAAKLERVLQSRPRLYYTVIVVLVVPTLFIIPELTPVLPINQYVKYYRKQEVNGRVELTGDYADMFGWDEQVRLVDSVYQSLSATEKQNCELWAENYGEAGALKILGKKYHLPNPICRHGSFWLWGYGDADAKIWISLGNETNSVEHVFEDVKLVKRIKHKFAISEENDIPLYICRNPKVDIPVWWRNYEDHIFE